MVSLPLRSFSWRRAEKTKSARRSSTATWRSALKAHPATWRSASKAHRPPSRLSVVATDVPRWGHHSKGLRRAFAVALLDIGQLRE